VERATESAGVSPRELNEVREEVTRLLVDLIRIDTSNPPGNESRVAEYLDGYFRAAGLQGEIVGAPEDRRSFVLRLEGARSGPSLLLLAHEDVVPASRDDWHVDPFAGLVEGDYVWGRGAVDIKNLLAANAVAVRRLAASGRQFAGTVVYAATADEEVGRESGARWLVEHRPDLIRCDYVLNEGGAHRMTPDGRHVYLIEHGEKGTAQFRVVVRGDSGHGSMPLRGSNALLAASEIVRILSSHECPLWIEESSRDLVELFVESPGLQDRLRSPEAARAGLAELNASDPALSDMIQPLYGFSFCVTDVSTNSPAVNVYPSRVDITVDCRTPAGHDRGEVEAEVHKALSEVDADWSLEWERVVTGNASPFPTALSRAIGRVMGRLVPGSEIAGSHCVAFTDSNWFRKAFPDAVTYSFNPHLFDSHEDMTRRCHNKDERIHRCDLALQALHAEGVALELLR
jgi:acetylornithine deacetylase/succinyl-diaminopimelate desuccinylase-like protein